MEHGTRLGPYEILEPLGAGGMGEVYLAQDTRLGRQVAVKVLPEKFAWDPERQARFQQEARAAAVLNHPNIATVHDVGEERGANFIVMEVVRGDSVREIVRRGALPVEQAILIAHGIAAGLARAHREGVLHRDLKPDNVQLGEEGQPKILDFGLGKLVDEVRLPDAAAATRAPTAAAPETDDEVPEMTRTGQVVGTLAYMSPEQLLGRPVDARTDVFSFGVTLYEMLAGERPFGGESQIETTTAILRDEPEPLATVRADVPEALRAIVDRCLAKDAEGRYASGQELLEALAPLAEPVGPSDSVPEAAASGIAARGAAAIVVLGLLITIGWLGLRGRRAAWARNEALPEIERLADTGDRDGAMRLLREAAAVIPDDPRLQQLSASILMPMTIESDPPGAEVLLKGYTATERPWISAGETPLQNVQVADPARIRIVKDGHVPFEGGLFADSTLRVRLHTEAETPEGMVRIPAGTVELGGGAPVELEAFWIDRYEVTNRRYKAFVDDGGYRRRELWPETFRAEGSALTWEEASAQFVDVTGRPGPAGWELGSYPEGTADHPVSGISWYEAAAFAEWSGRSLPTVFHWLQAAQQGIWAEILVVSNFSGDGAAPVGSYEGIGRFGTYDMAGNVGEWCLNGAGEARYLLGGSWSEPSYRYGDTDSVADPFDRSPRHGMRLMLTDDPPAGPATANVENPIYDFRREQPIGDAEFAIVRGMFAYDRSPLEASVDEAREPQEHWREEIVSIRAAYGDERVPVHLYLPTGSRPPYQAVVYVPGSDATLVSSSRNLRLAFADFVPRSGRALVYPVYKGTYERRVQAAGQNDIRDLMIQMNKDLRRTVDYLETRDDIDAGKLAYYGLSWGSTYGAMHTAIEDRFAAAVLLAGGLYRYPPERPPEALPVNFTPRTTVPLLMINGLNDFNLPAETNLQPMLEFWGAPAEHKRLTMIEGGHVPESSNLFIREALDWLDKYLGPVEGR